MKLSQKGWNNVIIFVTLGLILIFNFSGEWLNRNSEPSSEASGLVPAHGVITTMQLPNDKIERIGQGWRASSGKLTHEQINQLIGLWQHAKIKSFADPIRFESSHNRVKIWFAGNTEPVEYIFLELADKVLVKIDQQTYELLHPNLSQLLIES